MIQLQKEKSQSSCQKPLSLRFEGDDVAMAKGLKAGHPGAMEAFFDRYGGHVDHVVVRLLGFDNERYDLVQDVFVEAFTHIKSLKDDGALKGWLTSLAVFTVRQRIRKRSRRRVYWVHDVDDSMEVPVRGVDPEEVELLRLTYRVLAGLQADERIVFSLRVIEGMEVSEVAKACRVSPSTVKRRQKRAESRFVKIARRFPALAERIARGDRWRTK